MKKNLARVLGFWALAAYGIGDILGGGIYALVGKVAGAAGASCWISFGIAMAVASLTAFSYGELASRFPRSGGAAVYCREAFGLEWLGFLAGWMVLWSGMLSMATVSHAFAGYLATFRPGIPEAAVMSGFLLLLAGVNFRGMKESSGVNVLFTVIELSGLLLVLGSGIWFLTSQRAEAPVSAPAGMHGLFEGAALAFFAMVGFEDMVNVAEEAKHPEKEIPKAMLTAVAVAGALYMAVSFVASRVIPAEELSRSGAPLLTAVQRALPRFPAPVFAVVALFAVANTALLNFVMASRLLYGMAEDKLLPKWFGAVHETRKTPHHAILAVLLAAIGLALSGTFLHLAAATSSLVLLVFMLVNGALLVLKRKKAKTRPAFQVPWPVPVLGIAASAWLLRFMPPQSLAGALALTAVGGSALAARGLLRRTGLKV